MQVVLSFGPYPCNIDFGKPGPYNCDELGLMWLKHVAAFSRPGMLYNHSLILVLPRQIATPDDHLAVWGSVKRFPENSAVQSWPLGPNLVFQQVLWLQVHKKITGPFLWCEPDCIPVVPEWLDRLAEEYRHCGKPFLGANVEPRVLNNYRIPRHLSGNAIYPDEAFKLAPKILEARMTAWDVYAAEDILRQAYFTRQIKHDYRHEEIQTRAELAQVLDPETVLFHSDKYGAIAKLLAQKESGIKGNKRPDDSGITQTIRGSPLVEVFVQDQDFDEILGSVINRCQVDDEFRKKVAYAMLEYGIVNRGHIANYGKMKKAKEKTDAELQPEPAA